VADDSRTQTGTGDQDIREQLLQEIDEARARLAALERRFARDAAPRKPKTVGRVPSIDLERFEVDPAFIEIIPAETARKYRVLPLCVSRVFTIAMADPSNQRAIDEISARTGFLVQPVLANDVALDQALEHYYGPPGSTGASVRPAARGDLRIVWPRKEPPRDHPQESQDAEASGGGRSAA
jgi:hypothetical protein